jgi:hypothetical protein
MRAKHTKGYFEGAQGFFDPRMVLRAAKDNFGIKKVDDTSKKPRKIADWYVFCQHAKITSKTGYLQNYVGQKIVFYIYSS